MLPYLRGTRRSELHTRDGRAALAGSLRLALEDGGVTFIKLGAVTLSNGFAEALREELDLRIEAQNMTAVRAAAAADRANGSVRIPKPHESLCTANVLVMERLDGRALGTIMPSEEIGDRRVLARTLLDTLLREVMIEGVFHADPHPGNSPSS